MFATQATRLDDTPTLWNSVRPNVTTVLHLWFLNKGFGRARAPRTSAERKQTGRRPGFDLQVSAFKCILWFKSQNASLLSKCIVHHKRCDKSASPGDLPKPNPVASFPRSSQRPAESSSAYLYICIYICIDPYIYICL